PRKEWTEMILAMPGCRLSPLARVKAPRWPKSRGAGGVGGQGRPCPLGLPAQARAGPAVGALQQLLRLPQRRPGLGEARAPPRAVGARPGGLLPRGGDLVQGEQDVALEERQLAAFFGGPRRVLVLVPQGRRRRRPH